LPWSITRHNGQGLHHSIEHKHLIHFFIFSFFSSIWACYFIIRKGFYYLCNIYIGNFIYYQDFFLLWGVKTQFKMKEGTTYFVECFEGVGIIVHWPCFARQGYIVFRFVIEYSSLRDFGPSVVIIGLFLYEDFWNTRFWLVLKLEISYRVIIPWRIWVSFRVFFFWRLYFCMVKYLSFCNSSSFALRYF
jgi:hypothetical protein